MLDRPQNKHLKPVKPGEVRNPAGRPKGSRNKLSDAFLRALADDFEAHGKGVVEKVRTERPQDYLKIVASVMPKRMEVEDVCPPRRAADLSDDSLAAIVGECDRSWSRPAAANQAPSDAFRHQRQAATMGLSRGPDRSR